MQNAGLGATVTLVVLMKLLFHCGRSRRKTVDSLEEGLRWLSPVTDEYFSIEVRREHIVVDALKEARKAKFDPGKVVKVTKSM